MQSTLVRWSLVLGVSAACVVAGFAQEEAVRTDLVEETGRRIVQLDVTVGGPREAIADLARDDFELIVASRPVDTFTVDNLCSLLDAKEPTPESSETEAEAAPRPAPRRPASYLFYFEQNNLTVQGRVKALDMARELVGELIVDGNRGMVISSGRDLKTFVELTEDRDELLAGIDRLEQDLQHWWDPTFEPEDNRIQEVLEKIEERELAAAERMARLYQLEERWRTQKSLELFALVLARMADVDAPKAAVYFADTIRSNAGFHYLSYFSEKVRQEQGGMTAAHAMDRVIDEANALGIRLYTVQAQGLVTETSVAYAAGGNTRRFRDAEDSLAGLALETGGDHFLRGPKTTRIASDIRKDLECVYLLSFDPVGYRLDSPLPVTARVLRPDVEVKARGRLVVKSEKKRLHSRLLAAFAAGDGGETGYSLNGSVIPTGFEKGEFSALVQLHVPGSPLFASTWDLGLSLVSRGAVREDISGRVTVDGAGTPVVFEKTMTFRPGPFEIVAVGHELSSDDVVSHRVEGEWPDADDAAVSLGPIVVLQPASGAFVRDGGLRTEGSLALGEKGLARPDRPTALMGILCRGRTQRRPFLVERHLVGESAVDFEPLEMDLGKDRCAIFQDIINPGTMTDGGFEYRVRVSRGEEELAAATREFFVASETAPEASGS